MNPVSSAGQRNRRHQEPARGSQDHHVRVEPGRPEQDGAPSMPLPRPGSLLSCKVILVLASTLDLLGSCHFLDSSLFVVLGKKTDLSVSSDMPVRSASATGDEIARAGAGAEIKDLVTASQPLGYIRQDRARVTLHNLFVVYYTLAGICSIVRARAYESECASSENNQKCTFRFI